MNKFKRLAIDGGNPAVKDTVSPFVLGGSRIGKEEEDALVEVIRSKRLFRYYGLNFDGGSKVEQFEQSLASHIGASYALGVNSGTSALECAMRAMGVGCGDEVVIPAYAWVSNVTSVLRVGAIPIVAEVDESLCLDPRDLERKISSRTKLVVPVHMCGSSCDMDSIKKVSSLSGLHVLEDAAQAFGCTYKGGYAGTLGDAGIFSFQWNKMITSGEGGAIVTSTESIFNLSTAFHDVIGSYRNASIDEYVVGGSYRMSELQAAVLSIQLTRVSEMKSDLRRIKGQLVNEIQPLLSDTGVALRRHNDESGELGTDLFLLFNGCDADKVPFISKALAAEGVVANVLKNDMHVFDSWFPLLKNSACDMYRCMTEYDYYACSCPLSLDIFSRAIRIQISPDMTSAQASQYAEALIKVINAAL